MTHINQIISLKNRISYLEGKCAILKKHLEEELLKNSSNVAGKRKHFDPDSTYREAFESLKNQNQQLTSKIAWYRSSAWWYVKKPEWILALQNKLK